MSGDERKPDFSNVQGGASSSAPPAPKKADFSNVQAGASSTAPAPSAAAGATQTYTVAKGDTLSKIAKNFYGNANQWHAIYEANKDKIKNPDLIQPGWVLAIPPKK